MNTYLSAKDEKECYGCLSCVYSCPVGALSVEERFDKFSYPEIDTKKCINCDLCKKVCPNDNVEKITKPIINTYGLKNKDSEIVLNSTSGGAFTTISDILMKKGYKIYGSVFDENFKVRHIGSSSVEDRNRMRISKYVESSLENIYPQIKNYLENNTGVFFTGTACQVAGLNAYLKKDYENLITMDLVCNGLVSPKVFEDYLKLVSNGNKVLNFSFRGKKNHSWEDSYHEEIKCDGDINPAYLNYFYNFLTRSISKRESCSACKFAASSRPGDFTVGDFWSIEYLNPDFKDNNGVSLLTVNSEKGNILIDLIKESAELCETDKTKTIKTVHRMHGPVNKSEINEIFWKYYKKHSPEKTFDIFGGNSIKSKLIRKPLEYIKSHK